MTFLSDLQQPLLVLTFVYPTNFKLTKNLVQTIANRKYHGNVSMTGAVIPVSNYNISLGLRQPRHKEATYVS